MRQECNDTHLIGPSTFLLIQSVTGKLINIRNIVHLYKLVISPVHDSFLVTSSCVILSPACFFRGSWSEKLDRRV